MTVKLTGVGVHIYSGGFTIGMEQAGVEVLAQLEELDAGFETAQLNLATRMDHTLAPYEDWPLRTYQNRVNIVYANPPCAPWSLAGGRKGMDDPRIVYAMDSLDAGLKLNADFIVIESVCRAWSPTGGRPLFERFAHKAMRDGYAVTIFFTNAVLHGAPQLRQRFHFIAHKYEIRDLFTIAPLTYGDVSTVWDTIGDLEDRPDDEAWGHSRTVPDERELNVIRDLQQGESWGDAWRRVMARGLPAKPARFIAHRLIYDAPCGTILDIGAMVHPTQDRVLTLREGARLCGYPDDFQFARGKRGFHNSDVTQAVLPFVGRYLGAVFSLGMRRGLRVDGRDGIEVIDLRSFAKPFMPKKFISAGRPV